MQLKRHYDVLSDRMIYRKEIYMTDPEEGKRSMISFPVTSTMIIKLRGTPPDDEEIYANGNTNSTVIMEFLREYYLNDFGKYSRHLTQA